MYCEDSIQFTLGISPWWEIDEKFGYQRGRLVEAFIPHVGQLPYTLAPTGRAKPTEHKYAEVKIEPLRASDSHTSTKLPIAAMPLYGNEVRTLYRAKRRPAIILSEGGPEVDRSLTMGKPKWQTAPTVLVAPYYGTEEGDKRAGFNPELVKRIRRCEYPQFMCDIVPEYSSESILRFDQIQPIIRHHNAIKVTKYCLSEEALIILSEWLEWLFEGTFASDTLLGEAREHLLALP